MLRWHMALVLGVSAVLSQSAVTQDAKATLQTVNYDGLKEAINKQRSKVVLVDFWGEF